MKNCPVCGEKLKELYKDYIDYTLCEYNYECPNKCCGILFTYGNTELYLKDSEKQFGWTYTFSSEEIENIEKEFNSEAERIKNDKINSKLPSL